MAMNWIECIGLANPLVCYLNNYYLFSCDSYKQCMQYPSRDVERWAFSHKPPHKEKKNSQKIQFCANPFEKKNPFIVEIISDILL